MVEREEITERSLSTATSSTFVALGQKLEEKGRGTFASRHELLGVIREEYTEVEEAISEHHDLSRVRNELIDLAVGALFGIACIDQGSLDW